MGCCMSSSEYVTDPRTGEMKEKKKLGGAYPGQRRPVHDQYTPGEQEFNKLTGQAVVHFKAYGGGNALTLVKQDGTNAPASGGSTTGGGGTTGPQYVQVTLPDGVVSGQEIHVQAPDGKINAIIVPPGFGPGSTFTVEFAGAEEEQAPSSPYSSSPYNKTNEPLYTVDNNNNNNNNNTNSYNPSFNTTPVAQAEPIYNNNNNNYNSSNNQADDGFVSGFGRR